MNLERITPRASTVRGVDRWIRSFAPRPVPRASRVPRLVAGVGLALAGAAAALLLSPKTGREMRAITRKRLDALHRVARSVRSRGERPMRNGRATSVRVERD
jgi:hypothetical protein